MRQRLRLFLNIAFVTALPVASNAGEAAEDLGAAAGGVVGEVVGGPAGAAAGAMAGKYGVRTIDNAVKDAIDSHFDKENQDFANKNGVTIQQDGKTFKPQGQ